MIITVTKIETITSPQLKKPKTMYTGMYSMIKCLFDVLPIARSISTKLCNRHRPSNLGVKFQPVLHYKYVACINNNNYYFYYMYILLLTRRKMQTVCWMQSRRLWTMYLLFRQKKIWRAWKKKKGCVQRKCTGFLKVWCLIGYANVLL